MQARIALLHSRIAHMQAALPAAGAGTSCRPPDLAARMHGAPMVQVFAAAPTADQFVRNSRTASLIAPPLQPAPLHGPVKCTELRRTAACAPAHRERVQLLTASVTSTTQPSVTEHQAARNSVRPPVLPQRLCRVCLRGRNVATSTWLGSACHCMRELMAKAPASS